MCVCVCPTRSEKDVACGGVPGDDADTFGVTLQDHDGVGEGAGQRVIWDLPHLERRGEERPDCYTRSVTCPLTSVVYIHVHVCILGSC